ncbi:DUF1444 domain-containing protein [Alkalihalobacillus hwajinpoensis]|uniref:DUF1444 domain-containing protein n=1 Tax=Guptibacillus hwajinpoensis TaxID=208199 RepID=UPI001883E023|nr:DUF1444 domain-containing protein [Pseudalkalibacillus hwajinpoensis]MBF0706203.1 DUF1444 domain-containing protein [Pseudalkalibacillus hwajinpoensis]
MEPKELKKLLEKRLQQEDRELTYNQKEEKLRVEDSSTGKGISLGLKGLSAKYEERGEKILDEVVHHVEETLKVMREKQKLNGKENRIFPVIRSGSFASETEAGVPFVFEEHTAETRIYYALDLGHSYRLIDEEWLKKENWTKEALHEVSLFNLRGLSTEVKADTVAGNTFYFLNTNDGYDASRILNDSLLERMAKSAKGELAVAVPHQDVLIFADIENEQGYDALAQLTMHFFSSGLVPVTGLPFMYEDGKLEPVFIMAKNKPKK